MQIVLASQSPRRIKMLQDLALPFISLAHRYNELSTKKNIVQRVQEIAYQKARSVIPLLQQDSLIIGADTVVVQRNKILGKPLNQRVQQQYLQQLSNKSYHVFSAVALLHYQKKGDKIIQQKVAVQKSKVYFAKLSPALIKYYCHHFAECDCAGGYAIQGGGHLLIKRIEGSYSAVVGLPTTLLREMLDECSIKLFTRNI